MGVDYYDQYNHDEDDQFFQDFDYKPKPKKRKSTKKSKKGSQLKKGHSVP